MSSNGNGNGNGAGGGSIHILMFPWLTFGHISPSAHLARTLVSGNRGVRVTFLTAAGNIPRVKGMMASAADTVDIVHLQLPQVPGLPAEAANTAELSAAGAELLKAALLAQFRPDAVMFDFAVPWVCGLAAPLGIKTLRFSVFSAISGAFLDVTARRLQTQGSAKSDLTSAPTSFPSESALAAAVPAYLAADFAYVFTSFDGNPSVYDRVVAGIEATDGIVIKSCAEMEDHNIDYLSEQFGKPVLVAGLVVLEPPQGELEERWATWLSSFPDNAVTLASFRSETFLPVPVATELLLGLEATGRPFLAVLNFPKGVDAEAELKARVPPGFEARVRGRGVVHTGWMPQQHILHHRSVGCFLNHAGFSSVVEGLVAGCRLVLLPMKGDQFLNAALFAREHSVGVEVARSDKDGWFGPDHVARPVSAATADGGDGDGRKWREFLMDDAVQTRFAEKLVRDLKELVRSA